MQFEKLHDLVGIFTDRSAYIVGAGPSAAFVDVNKIPRNSVIISVNSSIMLMPWKDGESNNRFWISTDHLCTEWDYFSKHVIPSNCTKVVRENWREDSEILKHPNFVFFHAREKNDFNDFGLLGYSSGLAAVDLTILMGCKKTYLIGCDSRTLHSNSHMWQFWPKDKWPIRKGKNRHYFPCQKQQLKVFINSVPLFQKLNELAKQKGIKIYNCSSISTINAFEKMSFEESVRE